MAIRRSGGGFARVQAASANFDVSAAVLVSDFIDIGDRVVGRFVWHGEGHGPEANLEATAVFTVRKGKILSGEFFWNHAEALEAVDLSD